jgi:hypothetical protein
MRRATVRAVVAAALAVAAAGAGCGDDGRVATIRPWPSEPPYLPPPDPGRTTGSGAGDDRTATAAGGAEDSVAPPTDADVARDLRQAYGLRPGDDAQALVDAATVSHDGMATVPPGAPARVAQIIRGANEVARKPYVYGGGHGRLAEETWIDTAYDCSGSVSYALAGAALVASPMDSSTLARWGRPGPGRWVSIYANAGHAFMTVAGLRFDTSGRQEGGSRWQTASRSVAGFAVRHPPGL